MNAAQLLADLDAASVRVTRDGDDLRVRGKPGVSLAPYADRIRQHKPALLAELRLREQIIAAVTVEPGTSTETPTRSWCAGTTSSKRGKSPMTDRLDTHPEPGPCPTCGRWLKSGTHRNGPCPGRRRRRREQNQPVRIDR